MPVFASFCASCPAAITTSAELFDGMAVQTRSGMGQAHERREVGLARGRCRASDRRVDRTGNSAVTGQNCQSCRGDDYATENELSPRRNERCRRIAGGRILLHTGLSRRRATLIRDWLATADAEPQESDHVASGERIMRWYLWREVWPLESVEISSCWERDLIK